jgi:hypothetical protein
MRFGSKVPVECWHCGWRGWLSIDEIERLWRGDPADSASAGSPQASGSRPRAAS